MSFEVVVTLVTAGIEVGAAGYKSGRRKPVWLWSDLSNEIWQPGGGPNYDIHMVFVQQPLFKLHKYQLFDTPFHLITDFINGSPLTML